MATGSLLDPKLVRGIVIDGACLCTMRQRAGLLSKLSNDRRVIILSRLDLRDSAAAHTPPAALLLATRQLEVPPEQCLVVDHDHRRARLATLFGFRAAVLLVPGGHTRNLLVAGLMAKEDLKMMGLPVLNNLSQLTTALRVRKPA